MLPAADVGLVVGVATPLPPFTDSLAEVVVPLAFASDPFIAFSARRFCLDAEGAILKGGKEGEGGGRDGIGVALIDGKKFVKAATENVSRHHTRLRFLEILLQRLSHRNDLPSRHTPVNAAKLVRRSER